MELHAQVACSMPRELAKRGATWQTRAVYSEAILYCRENLTDGHISRGELPFWMPDMPAKTRAKHLDKLVDTGALLPDGKGWRFPDHVWRKWNPTKAEVDAKRTEEAARKADWRSRRKAERDAAVTGLSQRDINGTTTSVPALSHRCPRQPEPEPEPEPEPSSAYSRSLTVVDGETRGIEQTIDALAERFRA
jgi:hypothetical protein